MELTPTDRLSSIIRHLRHNCVFELLPGDPAKDGPQFTAKEVVIHYLSVVESIFETTHIVALLSVDTWDITFLPVEITPRKLTDGSIVLSIQRITDLTGTTLAQAIFSKYCKDDEDPDLISSDVLQLRIK